MSRGQEGSAYYEQSAYEIGRYILKHNANLDEAAEHFHITKSSITTRLKILEKVAALMAYDVKELLKKQREEKKIVQKSQGNNKPDNVTCSNIGSDKMGSMAEDKG
jgi:predicted DNA-binding protein YlxM (UPF0122 family)